MAREKTRYKAVIDKQTYTIIGNESKIHMDIVTSLVNEQLSEIKSMSPRIDSEQAAILLAVNAVSDQVNKQAQLLAIEKEVDALKEKTKHMEELENRIKRIEAMETEARDILKKSGHEEIEIHNHVEAQQVLNEDHKRQIQEKTSHK